MNAEKPPKKNPIWYYLN